MTNPTLVLIMEKLGSKDKDFRYMATNDLQNELGKESFKVGGDIEQDLCKAVLALLEDVSGDISGLAVKWYGGAVCCKKKQFCSKNAAVLREAVCCDPCLLCRQGVFVG